MTVNELFKKDLKVINMGLKSFYNDLKSQNVQAVHVIWKPRAGGNKKMASLLDRLKSTK
jgi:hypothetical protein